MIKLFKKLLKLSEKDFRKHYLNQLRLSRYPRYYHTKAYLKGKHIDIVDPCTFIKGYREIFSQQVYNFNSTTETPFILDCGSNIGLSVIYFKLKFPKARIISFEPDPGIFEVLRKNMEIFEFNDVELVNKAIWTNDNSIEFMSEGGWSGRIIKPGDITSVLSVPAFRLKNILNTDIDFLKLDIEGAEYSVLSDCLDELKNVRNLFIEYHSHINEEQKLDEILKMLRLSGFRYQIQEAFVNRAPFIRIETMTGMDLQLNIYAYR